MSRRAARLASRVLFAPAGAATPSFSETGVLDVAATTPSAAATLPAPC